MNKFEQASDLLRNSKNTGEAIFNLPDHLVPSTFEDAYAIQAAVECTIDRRIGWKIAATSKDGQKHIGVSGPIIGRITFSMSLNTDEFVSPKSNRMMVAEPEFVFVFNKTIEPTNTPFKREDIFSHVLCMKLGLEFPNSRYTQFEKAGELPLIADNACAHQFMLGPTVPELWRELALADHVVKIQTGTEHHYEGRGSNVLGDPVNALLWFLNEASKRKLVINEGDFVTTGTSTQPVPIQAGDKIRADFGILGEMHCQVDNI